MRVKIGKALVSTCLLVGLAGTGNANTSTVFPTGSLIIPVGSAFQDDCGAVSAYGLVYDVLRANPWLAANGYNQITIYYGFLDTKASPNRCVPTSLNVGASPAGPPTTSTMWNDGCDITNVSATLINNANHLTATTNIITYEDAASSTTVNQCNGGTSSGNTCTTVANPSSSCPGTTVTGGCSISVATCTPAHGATTATCYLNGTSTGCTDTTNRASHPSETCAFNPATTPSCKTGTVNAGQTCTVGAAGDTFCSEYACAAVTTTTSAKANVFPVYNSRTVTPGATVNYLGGPFIIAAQDVPTFRALLDGTLVSTVGGKCSDGTTCLSNTSCAAATTTGICGGPVNGAPRDIYGNLIDFTAFRTAPGTAPNGTQTPAPASTCSLGDDHHVNIHLAGGAFTANVGKAFQNVPPRIALLGTNNGGDTQKVYDGILEGYLQNAGLTYPGANGCPPASVNASTSSLCPSGNTSGQIYDLFDFDDLANNQLAALGPTGKPLYAMLWTPHWETNTGCSYHNATADVPAHCQHHGGSGTCIGPVANICTPTAGSCTFVADVPATSAGTICTPITPAESTALGYINTFLNGQNGLSAECASLASYEGDYQTGTASEESGLQLQTCINNGTGVCAASVTSFGIDRNPNPPGIGTGGGGGGGGGAGLSLNNCSDPGTPSGTECAYYSYPGDSFAQTGDYIWTAVTGHTAAFIPNPSTTAIYRPGVVPLISAAALNPALVTAAPSPYGGCATGMSWSACMSTSALAARAMIQADLTTRSIKDNTPGESNVLYLAGHDQTSSVSGTKVMLETLLQLGITTLPPTTSTTEVSRNSPIVATIPSVPTNLNPAIFQGTYEDVTPTVAPTTFTVTTDGPNFRFPAQKGHLRARTASTISTVQSTFGANGVLFDAATAIPAPLYAGCGTWYTSSCRTVFTTIVAGANPAIHYLQSSELANIGPLMGPAVTPNPALGSSDQALLIQRVLAGDDSVAHGVFQPKLGGVDRSTVAVIGTSTLVNGTRAQMAYFGATDGMLHAVCASTGTGGCDVLGRELWAYLPRTQLPIERYNTGRIDGSPRVMDMFGDFYNTGTKSWRTILTFQTGDGDTTTINRVPAVYALDISDPTNPKVLWEYSMASISPRNPHELGVGETLTAGQVQVGGLSKYLVFAQTNDAGSTLTAGSVVTAIDAEKGTQFWQIGYTYPAPRLPANSGKPVPVTGIPAGAIAIDKKGQGFITDVVFPDLYGDFWMVDPATGVSRYGTNKPEFSFSTDFHAIGAPPAIYSKGGIQYAVLADGQYADLSDTTWGTSTTAHYVLAVSLSAPVADATFTEAKGPPDVGFLFPFGTGESGYAQALVVGGQLFITTDNTDINSAAYGTGAASGHVYTVDLTANTIGSSVIVQGGAGSIANVGTTLYTGSSTQTQQLVNPALSTVGTSVDPSLTARVMRNLWLRTQ